MSTDWDAAQKRYQKRHPVLTQQPTADFDAARRHFFANLSLEGLVPGQPQRFTPGPSLETLEARDQERRLTEFLEVAAPGPQRFKPGPELADASMPMLPGQIRGTQEEQEAVDKEWREQEAKRLFDEADKLEADLGFPGGIPDYLRLKFANESFEIEKLRRDANSILAFKGPVQTAGRGFRFGEDVLGTAITQAGIKLAEAPDLGVGVAGLVQRGARALTGGEEGERGRIPVETLSAEFESQTGRKPTPSQALELQRLGANLPAGVQGAADLIALFLIPPFGAIPLEKGVLALARGVPPATRTLVKGIPPATRAAVRMTQDVAMSVPGGARVVFKAKGIQRVAGGAADEAIEAASNRLRQLKVHNTASAKKSLTELERQGVDVQDAQGALDDFTDTVRGDFDNAAEFKEARDELWDGFVDAVENLEPPEIPLAAVAPKPRVVWAPMGRPSKPLTPEPTTKPGIVEGRAVEVPDTDTLRELMAAEKRLPGRFSGVEEPDGRILIRDERGIGVPKLEWAADNGLIRLGDDGRIQEVPTAIDNYLATGLVPGKSIPIPFPPKLDDAVTLEQPALVTRPTVTPPVRGFGSVQGVKGVSVYLDDAINFAGRRTVVIRLANGKFQPFYKRTGGGSRPGEPKGAGPDDWAPIDGISIKNTPPDRPQTGTWMNKSAYVDAPEGLSRWGTEENKRIGLALKRMEDTFPQARTVTDGSEANRWMGVSDDFLEQGPGMSKGPTVPDAAPMPKPFIGPLRPLDEHMAEVVTSDNPAVRIFVGRTGINPSVVKSTDVGRLVVATERQALEVERSIEEALAAALDSHAQRFTGRIGHVLPIDINGFYGKTGKQWNDVFSRPDDFNLTRGERAYIDDYHRVLEEMNSILDANGFDILPLTKDGWFYVPRQTKEIRGITLSKPSNPNLQRVWEEATDGYGAGVRYDRSPRNTLMVHLRGQMRRITDQQMDEVIEPLSITPRELIPKRLRDSYAAAAQRRLRAINEVRRLRVPRVAKGQKLTDAEKQLRRELTKQRNAAKKELESARSHYFQVRDRYRKSLESAQKAEIAPGSLFGRAEDKIPIALWRNKFFPKEQQEELVSGLGLFGRRPKEHLHFFVKGIEVTGNYIRFLAAVGDMAAPFIQGLPVLTRNPVVWARAALRHYQALLDPTVQSRIIRDNLDQLQDMNRAGIPIGDVEFFAALQQGQGIPIGNLLEQLPKGREVRQLMSLGGRQTFGRFQASYNTFLLSARLGLWKAIRPGWRDTPSELGAYIRNLTGGLESRALGIGATQRALEGTWMAFSPKLLRSTIALMADAVTAMGKLGVGQRPSARQIESLRTLGQLVSGATGIYVATGLALGRSWEEIGEGLKPLNGKKFLSYNFNGDWIGIGGQVRAITQFLTRTISALAPGGDPIENLKSLNVFDNPIINLYMSRGAPGVGIVGTVIEGMTGADANTFEEVDGLADIPFHIGESALPFTLQGRLEGEKAATSAFAFIGLRTSPGTPGERRNALRDEMTDVLKGLALTMAISPRLLDDIQSATNYAELPADGKALVDQMEIVRAATEDVAQQQREFRSEYQGYKDERTKIRKVQGEQIGAAAVALGPGRLFQDRLRDLQRDAARDIKQLEDASTDALAFIADLEPSTIAFDQSLNAYLSIVDAEDLRDDATGEYFYDERDRRLDAAGISPEMLTDIKAFLGRNDHPMVQKLRHDRAVLRPYWDVWKQVVAFDPAVQDAWEQYNSARSQRTRNGLLVLHPEIRALARTVSDIRADMRDSDLDSSVDLALVRWHVYKPKTLEGDILNRHLLKTYPERKTFEPQEAQLVPAR